MRLFGAGALPRDVLLQIAKHLPKRDFYALFSVNREAYFSLHPLCREIFKLSTFPMDQQLELLADTYMRLHRFTQFGSKYADQLIESLTRYLLEQDVTSTQVALAGICILEALRFCNIVLDEKTKTKINKKTRAALNFLMVFKPKFVEIILLLYSINKADKKWIEGYQREHWSNYDAIRSNISLVQKNCTTVEFTIYIKLAAFIENMAAFDIALDPRTNYCNHRALYPLLEVLTKYNHLGISQSEKKILTKHFLHLFYFNNDYVKDSYQSYPGRRDLDLMLIRRMSPILEIDLNSDSDEFAKWFKYFCKESAEYVKRCDELRTQGTKSVVLPTQHSTLHYTDLLALIKAHSFEDKDITALDLLFDELFNAICLYQNEITVDVAKQSLFLITKRTQCACLNLHVDNDNHIPAMLFLLSRVDTEEKNCFFSVYFDEKRIRLICKKANLVQALVKFTSSLKEKDSLINVFAIFHKIFTESISRVNISVVQYLLPTLADYYLQNPKERVRACQQLCDLVESEDNSIQLDALHEINKILRSNLSDQDSGKIILQRKLIDFFENGMQNLCAAYDQINNAYDWRHFSRNDEKRHERRESARLVDSWLVTYISMLCSSSQGLPKEEQNKGLSTLLKLITTRGMPYSDLYNVHALLLECFILIPDNLLSDHIPEGHLKTIQKLDLFSAPISENYKYHCVPPEEKPEETPEADKKKSSKCVIA